MASLPSRRRSFYELTFGVDPGGAHKQATYIRGTLDELKGDLDAELGDGFNLYLLCCYGADLFLGVFQHGDRTHRIDLHPFITISIDGYPDISFDGAGKVLGYDFLSGLEEGAQDGSLAAKLFASELAGQTRVHVAWDRVAVPPLAGDVARPGDVVNVRGDWLDDDAGADEEALLEEGYVCYGFTDHEP